MDIGRNILDLRREKGVTQEALAENVGVSSQAVSKWENGGTPDIVHIPAIADYFGVSTDRLFGRKTRDYVDLNQELWESIGQVGEMKDRLTKVFEYCWLMNAAIMNGHGSMEDFKPIAKVMEEKSRNHFSQMVFDTGIANMGLSKDMPYFLIMPEPERGWGAELFFKEEYVEFFTFLADSDSLRALFYLYSRKNKPFTAKLLEKDLGISQNKVDEILANMVKYWFISAWEIELDDEIKTVNSFNAKYHFMPIMMFVEEILQMAEHGVSFMYQCHHRNEPYLRVKDK